MRNTLFTILVLYAPVLLGSGWNDYKLDIGDGYSILRANSFEVVLMHNMNIIISNYEYRDIGPITHYYKNDESIFLKTAGWEYRNRYKGDSFKNIDQTITYYFIVNIETKQVDGPLDISDFKENIAVNKAGKIEWMKPKNPNFWTPLIGNMLFILVSLIILPVRVWYISIPVILVYGWFVYTQRKKRRKKNELHNDKSNHLD